MPKFLPGLTAFEANVRLESFGPNVIVGYQASKARTFLRQFQSPLIYLLIVAALISLFLSGITDTLTILAILMVNALLGFSQEYRSEKLIEKLHSLIKRTAQVRRSGVVVRILQEEIVPGDVVILEEGNVVPADGKLLFGESFLVDEATISGESIPMGKSTGDSVFLGTTVAHGQGEMEVATTGMATAFGKIAALSTSTRKKSEFEENIGKLSSFLIRATLAILGIIFVINLLVHGVNPKNLVELLLFAVALAISIVPEALPVISTLTLSVGALRMAREKVVVKRLSAVEDLGNIEVLCTDKTGTITQNQMTVEKIVSLDITKMESFLRAVLEPGSPIDDALAQKLTAKLAVKVWSYLPFDPKIRRRYALVSLARVRYLVVFGAADEVGSLCLAVPKNVSEDIANGEKNGIKHLVLGYRKVTGAFSLKKGFDDRRLTYLGYCALFDPIRPTAMEAIAQAEKLCVTVKIITGDSLPIAEFVARKVGLLAQGNGQAYLGGEIDKMDEKKLQDAVTTGVVFAKISPEQKFRIIQALRQKYVVGYQGDGINDAPALKVANVGIAVQNAADVAIEAADIILLHKDLKVIVDGIEQGRKIFANIDKYIKHTMVGNWGNFFALAIISLFTSFLPLLPVQILLTNLVSDLPLLLVSLDNVDRSELVSPARYQPAELVVLPLLLGVITMAVNLFLFFSFRDLPVPELRTLWFVLITVTELIIIFSVRRKGLMFLGRRPNIYLVLGIIITIIGTFALPYLPVGAIFSLVAVSPMRMFAIGMVAVSYLLILDLAKVIYYRVGATK